MSEIAVLIRMGNSAISVPFVILSTVWRLHFSFHSLASLRGRIAFLVLLAMFFVFNI